MIANDKKRFDPFNDQTARDIRNALSVAFVKGVQSRSSAALYKLAEALQSSVQEEIYLEYIRKRMTRYEAAFAIIKEQEMVVAIQQSLVLWDEKLFFEVHELLEKEWRQAKGDRKKALQGMIRAAGMYVHLEQGNMTGAGKMAEKSIQALQNYGDELHIKKIDLLIDALEHLAAVPPRLNSQQEKD